MEEDHREESNGLSDNPEGETEYTRGLRGLEEIYGQKTVALACEMLKDEDEDLDESKYLRSINAFQCTLRRNSEKKAGLHCYI